MGNRSLWQPRALVVSLLLGFTLLWLAVPGVSPATAAAKTVYLPADWNNGNVPWVASRTRESANFALYWGDQAGTDPTTAPSAYRFDPADVLNQLETLYSFYVNTLRFTPETGQLAKYKIMVIITNTWSNAPHLNAWATGGSADGVVGVINVAPGAAQSGSWGLAHELAHVFQNYTFLGRPGFGLTNASAGTFWETSAEFMAMQVYPGKAAGDLTRFLRTENLAYSSSRHHYGNWMLVQYLVDHYGGTAMFNRIWNEATPSEHPLEVYRRIAGITQAQLAQRIGEYAQRQVTWDYSNRSQIMPFINGLYPFVTAHNGIHVNAVNAAAGHYAVPDALAPSDFGYNKIKLVPSTDGGLIRLHFKGHVNAAAQSGWTYGFVAVKNGTPRYGPIHSSPDGVVSFQTEPGEKDVYLVVAGAPSTVHRYAFLDGYTKNYRYPYEFGLAGAVPSGHEPGYTRPTAPGGGRWHANGGGWVDSRATVASTAYIGPRAAVFGNARVADNARIEGMAWVNSGGTVNGNAVVKDNALIQGGVTIGGTAVVGGDAEPTGTCTSGTYLLFNPDRGCDGRGGEPDVNPAHGTFTDAEVAVDPTTPTATPSPTATATPSPTPTATATATPTATATTTATPTTPGPTATTPAPGKSCTASYRVVGQWTGGFQGEVVVTAGSTAISGWTVSWAFTNGQTAGQAWGGSLTSNGAVVSASNAGWNGALAAGASATLGFIGTSGTANNVPAVGCTAT